MSVLPLMIRPQCMSPPPLASVSFSVISGAGLDGSYILAEFRLQGKPVSLEAQQLPQQDQGGLRWMEAGPGPTGDRKGPPERVGEDRLKFFRTHSRPLPRLPCS